ncbi:MAG: SiaB family protein kinase, partial [Rhodospirillaceae bacterium]
MLDSQSSNTFLASDLALLRETMHGRGVLFCFSGYMTESILTGMAGAVRQKLEVEDADRRTMKGLFSIFIELVQNVIRYSTEKHEETCSGAAIDLRYGVITVGKQDETYYVACGNMISNTDVARIKEGLDRILELDRKSLQALQKEILRGPTPETSKGAGVGFI